MSFDFSRRPRAAGGRRFRWPLLALIGGLLLVGLPSALDAAPPARGKTPPQRWAMLIGIDDYTQMKHLRYCGSDQVALHQQLATAGFPADHMYLLHDKATENRFKPFKANIEQQLKLLLSLAGKDDLVVFSFSGHGLQLGEKRYLCPADGNWQKPETLVPLDDVYRQLSDAPAALRLMIIDACRDDPRREGTRSAANIEELKDFAKARPPQGILCLNSCGPGQLSQEDHALKHGVFMHYLLEGWGGRADKTDSGRVLLGDLVTFARDETKKHVAHKFNDFQTPFLSGEFDAEVLRFDMGIALSARPLKAPFTAAAAKAAQRLWAAKLRLPETTSNSIGMRLVLIPPGEFMMGSGESVESAVAYFKNNYAQDLTGTGLQHELPQHRVRLTRPFYMGAHEVTRGQFARFIAATGYVTEAEQDAKATETWRRASFTQTDDHPVVNVSYRDVTEFCAWLGRKEQRDYRLPTEAQWEYCARAGTTTRFASGDDAETLAQIGNVSDMTGKEKITSWKSYIKARDGYVYTAPVGRFQPNAFGLYDMQGNVWEWCRDWYAKDYYSRSPVDDPPGPDTGTLRICRGGGWNGLPYGCRISNRHFLSGDYRTDGDLGFRVVLVGL